MRFFLVLISFGFWVGQIFAQPGQNLVRNPSFEDVTANSFSCVCLCNRHWFAPTGKAKTISTLWTNSPVVQCDTIFSVPHNNSGDQYPRTGGSYLTFYNWPTQGPQGQLTDNWYAFTRLKTPLQANRRYCGEMYLSRPDKKRLICQNFGMVFIPDSPVYALSQTPPFLVETSNFPVTSDLRRIEYFNVPISAHAQGLDLSDTMHWVPLRGGFTASGNER